MKSHYFEKLKQSLSKDQINLLEEGLKHEQERVQKRFPFAVTLTGVVGLVSTLYAVEKLLDMTFLIEKPWYLLILGIFLLAITGLLYKKL